MLKHGQFAYGDVTVWTPPISLESFVSDADKTYFKAIVSQSPQSGGHQERLDPNGSLASEQNLGLPPDKTSLC